MHMYSLCGFSARSRHMISLFWINLQTVIGVIIINVYVVLRVYDFANENKLEKCNVYT